MRTSTLAKDSRANNSFCLKLSNLKMILEFVPDLLGAINVWLRKILKQLKLNEIILKSSFKCDTPNCLTTHDT